MLPRWWTILLSVCCPGLAHYCNDRPREGAAWMTTTFGAYSLPLLGVDPAWGRLGLVLHVACVAVTVLQSRAGRFAMDAEATTANEPLADG